MKLYKSLFLTLGALLAVCCAKEMSDPEARTVLTKEQAMTFAAENAPAQTMEVYADGEWKAEVEADWIHVDPMYGTGAITVSITVDDNHDASGAVDNPRFANIYFRGGSSEPGRFGVLTINQKGDTYKGKPEYNVAQLIAAAPDDVCKLPSVYVAAACKSGFVVLDETGYVYVVGSPEGLSFGDKVFLNGKRGEYKGLPAFILDEADVRGAEEISLPAAKEIDIATYSAATTEYVKVSGSIVGLVTDGVLSGAAIRIPGKDRRMMIADTPAEAGLAAYNYHKVEASGFYNGTSGNNASFVLCDIKDNGLDESVVPKPMEPGSVLFFDDFNWMDPYVAYYNGKNPTKPLGKSVEENNASGNAPNAYTTADIVDSGLMTEFTARGYVDINAAQTSIYPQDTYWKFGKTSVHTGLRLPFVNYFGEVEISFDWSPHMTGSGNIDKVNPVVEVITGENAVVSDPFENDWVKGQMGWKKVKTTINITPESEIRVRPQYMEDHDGVTQMRWYIDNIQVRVPAPDVPPVYAEIKSDTDLLAFEGSGGEQTIKISSDHDFTVEASEKWLDFDVKSSPAGENVQIKVTCEASELSVLRRAFVTIKSGDSSMAIPVFQSAAGQNLDPLLSLSKNAATISCDGGSLKVKVQSNVDYNVSVDAAWVTLAPATKAVKSEDVEFIVEAYDNTTEPRVAHAKFTAGSMESILTITQNPKSSVSTVYFSDDFSWLDPIVEAYNATAETKVGKTVESGGTDAEAPNIWNIDALKSAVEPLFTAKGYTDLNPSEKLMYLQDGYLKFSRTGGHNTALQLQVSTLPGSPTDVEISFDFCMMVQGTGVVDAGPVGVAIVGDGQFENGTKLSEGKTSAQETGKFLWNHTGAITATGVTKNTKFVFLMQRIYLSEGSYNFAVSGAGRFFIDNILIKSK